MGPRMSSDLLLVGSLRLTRLIREETLVGQVLQASGLPVTDAANSEFMIGRNPR